MLSIFLCTTIFLYNYIGKYIFIIPLTLLYLNYVKINKLNNFKDSKYLRLSKINDKIMNIIKFDYNNFILNNNNNKLLYCFIKFDNIILIITNEFLLFILFYMKICIKCIITNQFTSNIKITTNTNTNISDIVQRKKNIINLINKNK